MAADGDSIAVDPLTPHHQRQPRSGDHFRRTPNAEPAGLIRGGGTGAPLAQHPGVLATGSIVRRTGTDFSFTRQRKKSRV
ncbi:hypothetical protein MKK75_08770 [Methylobacterium sp. J-030]|uniref:hypothetical protein n=1 Tax=Methylobacterium sp. J-030 TaxID=2836627 RepID=UPI001FBA62BD|nr:hypothetical protein [Methylobacterium sp. J-030]MCJ2068892.1 hypothetical protein [Methylobacterium sp. J-030]